MTGGTVSRDECMILNDALGHKSPNHCYSMVHNSGDDPFSYSNDKQFQGKDETHHRNSWLMPRLARKLTKSSPMHVSNWRKPVEFDATQCDNVRKLLEEKLGKQEALNKLPKACK
mmetsp:Transcript_2239/g.2695  ORF Transcript_2239/g.2695 Transcript_2239/m.2695 type:complete len:115 (+) Transcript_2239:97-441(+)|eukprot:CAMPEP_0195267818 /NCGR_PEP_ID=MMETSP0706-20130129/12805_1 /TAXON_ID=33640 /ORGANISM="Asterionellopsis glacialis, Strain CCMP134" /LENGTH=114 /DNA_ID=CAMNT_0040322619 /DNA_START=45 /DNA_END=389 /DNA_ORIENTATION=+